MTQSVPSDLDLTTASAGFQLVSPYSPAGDQPQAIEKLVAGFESGLAKQVLLGVTGADLTNLGGALILDASNTVKLLEVIGDEGYDDPETLKADLALLTKFRAIANDMGDTADRLFQLITTAQE